MVTHLRGVRLHIACTCMAVKSEYSFAQGQVSCGQKHVNKFKMLNADFSHNKQNNFTLRVFHVFKRYLTKRGQYQNVVVSAPRRRPSHGHKEAKSMAVKIRKIKAKFLAVKSTSTKFKMLKDYSRLFKQ